MGAQFRAGNVIGSFDADGAFQGSPMAAAELDFEQDLFAAVRFVERGQIALLVPFVETVRRSHGDSEAGGGLGDLNMSGRYDFYLAGQSKWLPGIAMLVGVTLPTGTPPDVAQKPLATDATGTGTLQASLGLSLEQSYGDFLIDLTGLVARRMGRTVRGVDETLGTQYTALGALTYSFPRGEAIALVLSYTAEQDATINGDVAPNTGRRLPLVSVAGLWPISSAWRIQGSASLNPPIDDLGKNEPVQEALTLSVIWSDS